MGLQSSPRHERHPTRPHTGVFRPAGGNSSRRGKRRRRSHHRLHIWQIARASSRPSFRSSRTAKSSQAYRELFRDTRNSFTSALRSSSAFITRKPTPTLRNKISQQSLKSPRWDSLSPGLGEPSPALLFWGLREGFCYWSWPIGYAVENGIGPSEVIKPSHRIT